MTEPNMLTASQAARAIRDGKLSCESLAEACLARIEAREDDVRAWAHVDRDRVLEQAREHDRVGADGALRGIPVGIKDVIDTADMPTQLGSPIYRGITASCDAASVGLLKEAGALILGKTETTEFAMRHPAPTRNPHNLDHTPGGSSSGSAAAVADFMVPLALGTQTTGSTIRPGSFCGVFAFKPTFGTINRAGLKFVSESQDTITVFARTLEDVAMLVDCIGACMPLAPALEMDAPPRIGFCRTPYWERAETTTQAALEDAGSRLAACGAKLCDLDLPDTFDGFADDQEAIVNFEMKMALSHERIARPSLLSDTLKGRLARADAIDRKRYLEANQRLARRQQASADLFRDFDAIMAPSAAGEAPRGLTSTGEPIFQIIWQGLQCPCVNVPALTGPTGLPVGIQIIGDRYRDRQVIYCAEWVRRALS